MGIAGSLQVEPEIGEEEVESPKLKKTAQKKAVKV